MFEGFVYLLVFVFCFLFLSLVFIGLAICVGVAFFDFILFWIFSALESIGLCLLPIRSFFFASLIDKMVLHFSIKYFSLL